MSNPTKSEIAQALGAEQLKGAKEAGAEAAKAGEILDPKSQELQTLVDQALSVPSQPVIIQVSRKANLRGRYSYIGTIDYIDAQSFAQLGIMYLVKDYSGGGVYECTVQVTGLKDSIVQFEVEGDLLTPKPERTAQQTQQSFYNPQNPPPQGFGVQQGFGQLPAQTMAPGTTMPWNPAMSQAMNPMNPLHQQMMSMGYNPMMQQQQQPNNGMDKVLDTMRQLMTEQRELFSSTADDPERRLMEAKLQEAKDDRLRAEAEAKRSEDRRALEKQMEQASRDQEKQMEQMRRDQEKLIEKFATPPENTSVKLLEVLGPLIGPLLPELLNRGSESAKATNALFGTVLEQQRDSSKSQLDTMKLMMERPGVEDRMAKIANAVGGSMANQVGLVGTLLNGVLQNQAGDNPPAWLSVVSQLIDTGGAVAQAMVNGAFEDEEEAGAGAPQMQRPPGWDPALQGEQARARILGRSGGEEEEEGEVVEIGAEGSDPQIEEFDTAMQTIFTMISQDVDSNKIAFQLWKHAVSGVRIAHDWFTHPEEGTHTILKSLRDNQQITVSDQRIGEVAASIRAFYDHLDAKKPPEDFIRQHNIRTRMPRSIRTPVAPQQPTANMDGQNNDEFGQGAQASSPVGKLTMVEGGKAVEGVAAVTPMGTGGLPPSMHRGDPPPSDGARLADMADRAKRAQQASPGAGTAGATRQFSKPPVVIDPPKPKIEGEEGQVEGEKAPTPETPEPSEPQSP